MSSESPVIDKAEERPDWLDYPNGLKLAAPPHQGPAICQSCGAHPGQYHRFDCPHVVCPQCDGHYMFCDCTDPLLVTKVYTSVDQIKRELNAIATEYTGDPTNVDYGTNDAVRLALKAAAFRNMIALDRAARKILTGYTRGQLKRLRDQGRVPRPAEQALIMLKQAHDLWLAFFWK